MQAPGPDKNPHDSHRYEGDQMSRCCVQEQRTGLVGLQTGAALPGMRSRSRSFAALTSDTGARYKDPLCICASVHHRLAGPQGCNRCLSLADSTSLCRSTPFRSQTSELTDAGTAYATTSGKVPHNKGFAQVNCLRLSYFPPTPPAPGSFAEGSCNNSKL